MKHTLCAGTWLTAAGGWLAGDSVVAAGAVCAGVLLWPWGRRLIASVIAGLWRLGVRVWHRWVQARVAPSGNHGTARWSREDELAAAGLFGPHGLIIGRFGKRLLRHPSREANMIVFAPQGAGKGAGVVIPNLLTHPGSVICIDPKGENFAVTAKERLRFGPVWLMSMAGGGPSHFFNPLDTVEVGSGNEVAAAARLAELIMPHEITSEAHWRAKAVQWVTGLIIHVAVRFADEPARRHLGMVHEYLTLPPASFARLVAAMAASPARAVREVAAELARGGATGEGLSILSSMVKGTALFSLGRRSGQLSTRSDFDIRDLFGVEPASLYLQVPLGEMAVYAPWLRVMIGLANHASMTVGKVPDKRPLFVLDEAATLGEIRELQETIGQGRAYHQKLFIYQDMAQLRASNRSWASVLANCQVCMSFAVNDLDTAETLSRRLGDRTVLSRSFGVSGGADAVLAHHQNIGQGELGRRLLQPNEILHLPIDQAVVTIQGVGLPGPVLASRIRYWTEAMFAGRFGAWCGKLSAAHLAVFQWLAGVDAGVPEVGCTQMPPSASGDTPRLFECEQR